MTSQHAPTLKPKSASKQKLRLWIRLLGASRNIEAVLRSRLRAAFGATLPQFDVMAALARKPVGMTMTELSRYLMVSNGNVTGIIDRLVADGFVVRLANAQDRRATVVRLTRRGSQAFRVMAEAHEVWVNEVLAGLDRDRCETMIDLLAGLGLAPHRGDEPA
jgi:DNA-binding MarR family transcriptional regulator